MAKTLIRAALLLALAAPLAGCANNPPIAASGAIGFWCATNEAERPTVEQYAGYSEKQRRDMDVHNTYGERNCGWKP